MLLLLLRPVTHSLYPAASYCILKKKRNAVITGLKGLIDAYVFSAVVLFPIFLIRQVLIYIPFQVVT